MGKKSPPALRLDAKAWRALVAEGGQQLRSLAQEQHRGPDIARELAASLLTGGVLDSAPADLRLQVLAALEQHAVVLCGDAPTDLTRQLYEVVRDRSAHGLALDPQGAARLQQAALGALTTLLISLEMQQRDARLVKVHVETLFRIVERSGQHAAASPDLCRCAAACLRHMEEAAPTLLLAGCKQLLELARQETSEAAESYVMLAASVLSHGAARCLDLSPAGSGEPSGSPAAELAEACCAATAQHEQRLVLQQQLEEEEEREAAEKSEEEADPYRALAGIDARALALGGSGCCEGELHPSAAAAGASHISPVTTLEGRQCKLAFASGRTLASSEELNNPTEGPESPRAVASVVGTVSTFDGSAGALAAAAARDAAATAAAPVGSLAHGPLARGHSLASGEFSGSVQMDGTAAQPLLAGNGPGLRHYRVPQHLHWPDALAHTALCVYVTPAAQQDMQQACLEFLAAMPKLSVEGVAAVTSALPAIMRLAELAPGQLAGALDSLLHSGRALMLQAVLKLYEAVPRQGFAEWQARLVDSVLMMINGPHTPEHRVISLTWCLVQHHAQMHSRRAPSLFAGSWRQLLPRSDDPAQLLSLKVKALSACLAVGIGRPEEICPMIFSWDGFWQAHPSDQQQRLATYALRMCGSAAASYAAMPAAQVELARRCAAGSCAAAARPAASPQYLQACLASACLQLLATRPQYVPSVDAFLAHCGSCCPDLQLTLLNAVDALFSAAASAGTFTSLRPRSSGIRPAPAKQRSGGSRLLQTAAAEEGRTSPKASGLGGLLQRMRRSVTRRADAFAGAAPSLQRLSSMLSSGSATASGESGAAAAGELHTIAEAAPCGLAAPQPPAGLDSWQAAKAWLWDSRTWATLSTNLLGRDPMMLRPLLLRMAQSGTDVLPMGALRLLAAYASQYQGETACHALPAKEAGNCVLAICQAAAMTHLLIGPAGTAAGAPGKASRGRARTCAEDAAGARGSSPGSDCGAEGASSPQWTQQQEEIAAAMQAVLSALTSHFPVESVRRRAQTFLDLLANPSAWDLRLRMGTMAKMLGGYFSEAVSIANYL